MFLRATVIWSAILASAIANGAFRQGVLIPQIGETAGHIVSSLMLSGVVLLVAWLAIGWLMPAGAGDAWLIGIYWLALTVAFEFLAGHFLFGTSWATLLNDYKVHEGRIWVLVLLTALVAPRVATLR